MSYDFQNLPTDPGTAQPLKPRPQPGYYPKFSTLGQRAYWDAATRNTILKRVNEPPPIRFFTSDEARLLEVVCSHLLPQDDRTPDRRIPIVPHIDARLHEHRTAGYRYEEMPHDWDAYRLGLQIFEQMALDTQGKPFLQLTWHEQDVLLKSVHDDKPAGAAELWKKMPAQRFWALLLGDICEAYYAHPWAWDEIGFGGPAYPRAYMRLENGEPEPWEVDEKRYEWQAPAAAVSDPAEEEIAAHSGHPVQGQGGTH